MKITYSELADAMEKVAKAKNDNPWKARTFYNFASLIRSSKSTDLKYLVSFRGIGPSCIKMAEEYLTTGKNQVVDDCQKLSYSECIENILEVPGIGEYRATQIVDAGYKSPSELVALNLEVGQLIPRTDVRVTNQMLVGLKFMAHTDRNRMSKYEYEQIAFPLVSEIKSISPEAIVELTGSYRRQKSTIGDIDIAVFLDDTSCIEVELFGYSQLLDEVVVGGTTKISGIKSRRQVDIRIVDKSVYGPMMMYFTGPARFNIELRRSAIKLGFKLSEYGLFKDEIRIDDNTESGIFKQLGFMYFAPNEREFVTLS